MPPPPKPAPPDRRPIERELFGDRVIDDYAWLRERDDPAVRELLAAERSYAEGTIEARAPGLRARLYAEMRARIKEDDSSVPGKDGPWLYYSRTELGDEYPRHCRRAFSDEGAFEDQPEQVYVDENQLADGLDYFDLAGLTISPNHRVCAFMVDREGDEFFDICCKDLDANELLTDSIEGCGGSLAWLDDEWLVYTRRDDTHRPWQAWRHKMGTPVSADVCIWEEDDPAFFVSVHRARSDAFLVISLDSQVTSEQWLIPTSAPETPPRLIAPRRSGVEYQVAHHIDAAGHERLFMLTNDPAQGPAQNFKIMVAPVTGAGPWRELIGAHDHVLLEDIDVFAGHLVVWERSDGLQRVRVVPLDPMPMRAGVTRRSNRNHQRAANVSGEHLIAFPDPTYTLWPGSNPEFHSTSLRFGYSSMTTPTSIYDYDLSDRSRALRKRIEVVGGHDPSAYASARIWAPTTNGERIPISAGVEARRRLHRSGAPPRPPAAAAALRLRSLRRDLGPELLEHAPEPARAWRHPSDRPRARRRRTRPSLV